MSNTVTRVKVYVSPDRKTRSMELEGEHDMLVGAVEAVARALDMNVTKKPEPAEETTFVPSGCESSSLDWYVFDRDNVLLARFAERGQAKYFASGRIGRHFANASALQLL